MRETEITTLLDDGRKYTLVVKDYFIIDEAVSMMMKAYGYGRRTGDMSVLDEARLDKNTKDYLIKTGIID